MTLRILVTGSRDWDDASEIERVLREVVAEFGDYLGNLVLVSGACPTGADRMAEDIWRKKLGRQVELHPADWEGLGKKAGFVRNSEMVKLGASVCVAFIKDNSKGASMTVDLATKAGIPVRISRVTTGG